MVIQELQLQDAIQTSPYTAQVSSVFIPEAILPARHFASAFSNSGAGFAPTSILIELFGALALSGTAEPIAAALLLGLSGLELDQFTPATAPTLLNKIIFTKTLRLSGAISVPFLSSEHLVLNQAGLTATHPDGVRLTAYHCVHPLVTRQFYATAESPLAFTEC